MEVKEKWCLVFKITHYTFPVWVNRYLTVECGQFVINSFFNNSLLSNLSVSYLKKILKHLALNIKKDVIPVFIKLNYAIINIFETEPIVFKKIYNITCV